jgi:4,5-DOPA dioxygenase extradiol
MMEGINKTKMPVLFVGHGSPMNAIVENEFSLKWMELGRTLPRPEVILCISAHWETKGTMVTSMEHPRTIHDFGGFPRSLFEVHYPAPGSISLAEEVRNLMKSTVVESDLHWGLDHGCWSVLSRMYPAADIPVVQLSLDYLQDAAWHYEMARSLKPLREQGVLIIGSGNIVHNLGMVAWNRLDEPGFGFDWAIEADTLFKKWILENDHGRLTDTGGFGKAARLAVPTPEHFLPMLYALAQREATDTVTFFNDKPVGGSLTMTSFITG